MTIDQVGFRLYRRAASETTLPGDNRTVAHVEYVPTPACGFYPLVGLFGARSAAAQAWPATGGVHLDMQQASELDINQLTQTPDISAMLAASIRASFYAGLLMPTSGSWGYVCADFPTPVDVPGQVGAEPIYNRVVTAGWDAGAISAEAFYGDGRVKFRVQAGKRFVVGLQAGSDPTNAKSRFFGFIIDAERTLDLMRTGLDEGSIISGTSPGGTYIPFPDTEEFTVEILRGKVYFKRGTSYNVNYPLSGEFAVKTVWSLGAAIWESGTWVGGVEVYGYSGGDTSFAPLAGRGGKAPIKSGAITKLPALLGAGGVATRSAASLPRLLGRGGRPLAEGYGSMPAMTGYGTDEWSSSTAPRSRGFLPAMRGYGHSKVGTVGRSAGSLMALKVRGTKGKIADSTGALAPLAGEGLALALDQAWMYAHGVMNDVLRPYAEIAVVINSAGNISTALAIGLVKDAALDTTATLSDAFTLSSILAALMESEVTVGADVPLYERGNEVWVVNLAENHATSTFEDYPFNSYGVIGGRAFGAKQDGLFLLEGDDDAGAPIRASVSYGKQDFGTPAMKNMSRAYVGASSTGKLYLKVIAGGKEYLYAARAASPEMAQMRFDVGRGLQANYFTFELFNKNGGDFEIDSVSFFAAEFKRRI